MSDIAVKQKDDGFASAKKQSSFKDVMIRLLHHPTGMIGLAIFLLMVLAGIFAPVLTPYGYNDINVMEAYQGSSAAHLLGTDELGRDMLTRLLYGARYSIGLGGAAQAVSRATSEERSTA